MTTIEPTSTAKVHNYGAFSVNEYISADDFKLVDFNPADLDRAFAQNPGLIAYFGHLLGKAKRQTANFKTRRDAIKAKVSKEVRDSLAKAGSKVTEGAVEAEMRANREFLEVSYAENHAIEVEQTIEALYWAVRGRRNDMEYFADKKRAELAAKGFSADRRRSD